MFCLFFFFTFSLFISISSRLNLTKILGWGEQRREIFFKVNNKDTRTTCRSGMTRRSVIFIVNFEHILHLILVFLLLTLNM